jgi:glycosyltransferase involved in cell wall biosynthesis|tara:strand:+ start:387 stop:1331 length:945 start_codon:yes stop_codon:yes gene_type:complete
MDFNTNIPKISIGFPIYNGERFVRNRLDSIISQSFQDFELIIVDNASTDSTIEICEEYAKKDKRIQFFKTRKNKGIRWAYESVLLKARGRYFMWVAADDKFSNDFVERNYLILESDDNIVASTSKVQWYGPGSSVRGYKIQKNDSIIEKKYKKIRQHFQPFGTDPIEGSYEERISKYLRKSNLYSFYALCRREELQKSWSDADEIIWDFSVIINLVRFGSIHVIDEILMEIYTEGISNSTVIELYQKERMSIIEVFFPRLRFTIWFYKIYGPKLFLKNFDYFVWNNAKGPLAFFISIIKLIKNKFNILKKLNNP